MMEPVEVMVEEPTYLRREITNEIDQHTGHRTRCIANTTDDEAALRQAQEPDRPNPPSGGPEMLPELPPICLPQDNRPARGFPGGGFPGGGGFPRGGVPRGGGGYPGGGGGPPGARPPGGGWGPPPIQMPQPQQGKLVGETPTIYDRDRKNTQLFINQWELYWGVNNDNPLIVTLPLNISLDVGSQHRAQHDLAEIDTDFLSHVLGRVTRPVCTWTQSVRWSMNHK